MPKKCQCGKILELVSESCPHSVTLFLCCPDTNTEDANEHACIEWDDTAHCLFCEGYMDELDCDTEFEDGWHWATDSHTTTTTGHAYKYGCSACEFDYDAHQGPNKEDDEIEYDYSSIRWMDEELHNITPEKLEELNKIHTKSS